MGKRIVTALLALLLLVSCTGCGIVRSVGAARENYEQDQLKRYVAFFSGDEMGDPVDSLEYEQYESVYSEYNARIMYQTMTSDQQLIYRLMEYASDHGFTSIFIDSRLLVGLSLTLENILQLYAMDSPMMQQNYSYTTQSTSYTFSYLEGLWEFEVSGTVISVEGFSAEAMTKKKAALAEAKTVYAQMPAGLSQLEQARFFFRYLIGQVQYNLTKASPDQQHNLYDAFINKKTQCDGFANAFSLLCSMAQIPCVEKVKSEEKDGEIGHTWNAFCADGIWYNADLALDEDYAKEHRELGVDFNFGFSDQRNKYVPDFAERFPSCTSDLLVPDLTASSTSDPALLGGIKQAFRATGREYVMVRLEEGELSKETLQKIANHIKSDIHTYAIPWGGVLHYFIFKR